jgi:hypothetical protein
MNNDHSRVVAQINEQSGMRPQTSHSQTDVQQTFQNTGNIQIQNTIQKSGGALIEGLKKLHVKEATSFIEHDLLSIISQNSEKDDASDYRICRWNGNQCRFVFDSLEGMFVHIFRLHKFKSGMDNVK